ncbi:MAG: methyltransferase protein [Caulobacter sp.]|nr:methyltransferase protein [Caulobacter sp.]
MTDQANEPLTGGGLAARQAAADLLEAALSRRAGVDEALSSPALARLEPRDRAFARALALSALRHLGAIDARLAPKLTREPPPRVRTLLRLGAVQALYMGVEPHAAVSTAVDIAAAGRETRAFKGMVNAILRGLLREAEAAGTSAANPALDPEQLAPPWLFARWRAAYGQEGAVAICALITAEPATDLTPRDPAEAEALATELDATLLPGPSMRTERRGDVTAWPGFAEGRWWVQDAAAAIPARLLAVQPGESALDLCAAPGGKTLQLAAAGAVVTALDRSAARLVRVTENLARMSLAAEIVTADAGDWPDERTFDAILLDAPCSATGTFRRNPDVLWAAQPKDIASLSAVQSRLLDAAARRLKPGGRLVYCVCSLEPEEGEAHVTTFLARNPDMALSPLQPGEGGAPEASLTAKGTLRLLPHHREGGQDGFFAARFVKT